MLRASEKIDGSEEFSVMSRDLPTAPVTKRVAIAYDCLFPWTIGGAERWLRDLAEGLASRGHQVTYLTLQQWDEADPPHIPGVDVVAVGPRLALYQDGKRRIWPPLRFGIGIFFHLLFNRRRYDRIHLCSFPYFALLAAAVLRPISRYSISVDWFEVWTREYWREYLGSVGGAIGWQIQRLCATVRQTAYCFSDLHTRRLLNLRRGKSVTRLHGLYKGVAGEAEAPRAPPTFVNAGRMIAEKRVLLFVEAMAIARRERPGICAIIFGRGPELDIVRTNIVELGLEDCVTLPGFVAEEVINAAMNTATAIVQPSGREGYGLVVVEASARGVPVVVLPGDDNSSVELVENGQNGFVATTATPEALATAIVAAADEAATLRARTRDWWRANEGRLSIGSSIAAIAAGLE